LSAPAESIAVRPLVSSSFQYPIRLVSVQVPALDELEDSGALAGALDDATELPVPADEEEELDEELDVLDDDEEPPGHGPSVSP
jgi:hypothetical protein